jgi:hypothetical protein
MLSLVAIVAAFGFAAVSGQSDWDGSTVKAILSNTQNFPGYNTGSIIHWYGTINSETGRIGFFLKPVSTQDKNLAVIFNFQTRTINNWSWNGTVVHNFIENAFPANFDNSGANSFVGNIVLSVEVAATTFEIYINGNWFTSFPRPGSMNLPGYQVWNTAAVRTLDGGSYTFNYLIVEP